MLTTVIKANSSRIWDIGDMEYALIADFLNELPVDQLAEIESVSPVSEARTLEHLMPNTTTGSTHKSLSGM